MITTRSTDSEIFTAWREGQDAGEGCTIGTSKRPRLAIDQESGWEWVRYVGEEGACLATDADGNLAAVCDANGPWAVSV